MQYNSDTNLFYSIDFGIVTSEVILSWSYGEVTSPFCINQITSKPVLNGLICPRIFGPMNRYECLCKRPLVDKLLYCKTCGVDFNINNIEARSRFGHIQLAVPVVHIWCYKLILDIISILLNISPSIVKGIINCELHIIIKSISDKFKADQIIDSKTYETLWNNKTVYEVLSGGRAILELLSKVNLDKYKSLLRIKYHSDLTNKLKDKTLLIKGLIKNKILPTDLVIKILPVMPAALRPLLMINGNDYANSNLNKLYSRIINANNNILFSLDIDNIDFWSYIKNLKLLQQVVNKLIDSPFNIESPVTHNNVVLKSLSELLKGKKGRFRNNLLGKRVDYSGRSVIVPGPELLLCECAIPRIMALELFKPFIQSKLMLMYKFIALEKAKFVLANDSELENELLKEVIKYCPVILNRAPTLHKLSIRAFWVKLTNEKVIRLHPLTCSGFNADFDGDQMAVHVPLSLEARMETVSLIISTENVLHPAHGDPAILPTQDMIMGLYYMSLRSFDCKSICFNTYSEMDTALALGEITLHTKINFNLNKNGNYIIITSTPGRLLIMEAIPFKCDFMYEWFAPDFNKERVFDVIKLVLKTCGKHEMIKVCETLMALGFKYASQSGISFSKQDLIQSEYKSTLIKNVRLIVNELWSKSCLKYGRNLIFWNLWTSVLNCVYNSVNLETPYYSINQTPIQIMFNSGARGTLSQLKQLVSAKGLGIIGFDMGSCKMPILKSYFEGLDLIHLFFCSYSSRRGMIDTALNTPSSGYLTRKLVEVCREWIISELDCGTELGVHIEPVLNIDFIKKRIIGRFLAKPVIYNNNVLLRANVLITEENISILLKYYNKYISIRSPLTCRAKAGTCKLCYGIDLGSNHLIKLGSSIGVLAAQAISEPGTQLTLRSFHGLTFEKDDWNKQKLRNCLHTLCSGFVKITNLSCICDFVGSIIVSNNNCMVSILEDNHIVWKSKLSIGTCLMVSNNAYVVQNQILGFDCLLDNSYISLIGGYVFIKDLIYDLNFSRNDKTYLPSNTNVSMIYIKAGISIFNCVVDIYKNNKLFIKPGSKINVFCSLLNVLSRKKDLFICLFSEERFSKLSRLFENKVVNKNDSVIVHIKSILRYGSTIDYFKTYVIDPVSISMKPIIYYINNGECLFNNNAIVYHGESIVLGDLNLNDYINIHGFNKFINYFINIIQEFYDSQGINVNSKHIEVVLRLMLDIVTVLDSSSASFKNKHDYKRQEVINASYYMNVILNKPIVFLNKIMGITDICFKQMSLLSSFSFRGIVKAIIKTMVTDGRSKLIGMKDSIILGKLPVSWLEVFKEE